MTLISFISAERVRKQERERKSGSEWKKKRVHRKKICSVYSVLVCDYVYRLFFYLFFLARMCICHAHALLVCLSCNTVDYKYLYSTSFDAHFFCFYPPFFEENQTHHFELLNRTPSEHFLYSVCPHAWVFSDITVSSARGAEACGPHNHTEWPQSPGINHCKQPWQENQRLGPYSSALCLACPGGPQMHQLTNCRLQWERGVMQQFLPAGSIIHLCRVYMYRLLSHH